MTAWQDSSAIVRDKGLWRVVDLLFGPYDSWLWLANGTPSELCSSPQK